MSRPTDTPEFIFVGDGALSDDAIEALARLLLELVDHDSTDKSAAETSRADQLAEFENAHQKEKAS